MVRRILERYVLACALLDSLVILAALASAEILRRTLPFGVFLGPGNYLNQVVYGMAWLCWLASSFHFKLYHWRWVLNLESEAGRILAAVAGFALLLAASLYLTFREVPRLLFVYTVPLTFLFVLLTHVLVRGVITLTTPRAARVRILIIGTDRTAQLLANRIVNWSRRWPPTTLVGFIATSAPFVGHIGKYPVLGDLTHLQQVLSEGGVTTVLLALPPEGHTTALRLSEALKRHTVDVRLLPDTLDLASARATIEYVEGLPLLGLRDPALSLSSRLIKYSFDRVASAVGLLLLAPLFALIALLIKLDSAGPVIYRARRIGEGGQPFDMLKFRSMAVDAETRLEEVVGPNGLGCGIYKVPNDPRVTRLGRFLRRTSLDELPQLINVLRGEMSIVGPRPEQPFIAEQYEPWQHKRTQVRPGLTGWWQVNGRSNKPLHQNTDFDIYYLENYSFWLDLRILGRTVGAVLKGRGAY